LDASGNFAAAGTLHQYALARRSRRRDNDVRDSLPRLGTANHTNLDTFFNCSIV
jgi:hypothetical protein